MSVPAAARARSFDAWADDYDRYRPSYPDALFAEIAARLRLPAVPQVVDLGAGTGIATLAMARRGWQVTAVEPGGPMLDVLRAKAAAEGLTVATVQAHAESTGLPDASADVATAAQAFHWFDHVAAVREMGRLLRPGGGIALFWNIRDAAASTFLAEYERALIRHGTKDDLGAPGRHPDTGRHIGEAGGFEPSEFFQVHHVRRMSQEDFIGLMLTAWYVRTREADVQARLVEDVRGLLAAHAGPSGSVEVPYVVDCETARRLRP